MTLYVEGRVLEYPVSNTEFNIPRSCQLYTSINTGRVVGQMGCVTGHIRRVAGNIPAQY
jgi:hypothetical protein